MNVGLLIKTEGTLEQLKPANGTNFSLKELRQAIGCEMIEVIRLKDTDNIMIGDDVARLYGDPQVNEIATKIYQQSWKTQSDIVGNIVLCSSSMLK